MEYFSVGLNAFCLLGQSILQTAFVGRLTEKKLQLGYWAVYPLLLMALEWLAVKLELYSFLAIGLQLIVLYGFNRLALQNQPWVAGAAAIWPSTLPSWLLEWLIPPRRCFFRS